MESVCIVCKARVTVDALCAFIERRWDGRWQYLGGLEQGVVERGEAAVYLALGDIAEELELDEREDVRRTLEAEPLSVIVIQIGRGNDSRPLASEVVADLCVTWPGVILDESGVLTR